MQSIDIVSLLLFSFPRKTFHDNIISNLNVLRNCLCHCFIYCAMTFKTPPTTIIIVGAMATSRLLKSENTNFSSQQLTYRLLRWLVSKSVLLFLFFFYPNSYAFNTLHMYVGTRMWQQNFPQSTFLCSHLPIWLYNRPTTTTTSS